MSIIRMNGQLSEKNFWWKEELSKEEKLQVAEEKERGDKARNVCLLFADDMAVVASNLFELQRRLSVAVEAVNALGLQFNAKKSVVLVQGKKAYFLEWRLKREAVKRVKEAKYLGLV
ncbi:hypothetical protein QOT17_018488 [Balamuthia mandrillaris]